MANCVRCGAVLEPGAMFCTNCGAKIEAAPVMQAEAPKPAAPVYEKKNLEDIFTRFTAVQDDLNAAFAAQESEIAALKEEAAENS